jgi:DNA-binding SARP family transcriptional activator
LDSIRDMPRLYVDALGHLIFILSHKGKFEEADSYYTEAMQTLTGPGESDMHAWIYLNQGFSFFISGDHAKAKSFGQRANAISKRIGRHHLLTMGYHLVSICDFFMGHFEKALATALKGIQLGEEKGFIETAHAWNWNDASLCASVLGRLDDAIAYGRKNLSICKDLGSLWSEAWAQRALTVAYLKSGDSPRAETAARSAVDLLEALDLPYDTAAIKMGLAAVLIEKGQWAEAFPLLETAQQMLEPFKAHLAGTLLMFARYYQENENRAAALVKLRDAVALGVKFRHERWLVGEQHWIVPLLVALYPDKTLQDYVEHQFLHFGCGSFLELGRIYANEKGEMKKSAHALLRALKQRPPPGLRVTCFGSFKLQRGDLEISADQWLGEKPKLLFKYLALSHGRGFIAKDELLECFWPNEAPDATSKRLHVALTKLRRTLEPELMRGMPSAYLQREGDAYRLNLGTGGFIDVAAFNREIEAARKATDKEQALIHYLKAESYYKGHLLDEDKYVPWCHDARETYKQHYLDVLEAIISGYRRQENWAKCIEFGQRYVTIDPYAEEVYQALMIFHHTMGSISMITKTYDLCKRKLETDLDCLLSDETTDLYKQLVLPKQDVQLT